VIYLTGAKKPLPSGIFWLLTVLNFSDKIGHMESINYNKKLARLKYKDLIFKMSEDGKSIREITQNINNRLSRTNLKVTLSKSTIHTIIKKGKKWN
jgi:hypothetical protein